MTLAGKAYTVIFRRTCCGNSLQHEDIVTSSRKNNSSGGICISLPENAPARLRTKYFKSQVIATMSLVAIVEKFSKIITNYFSK